MRRGMVSVFAFALIAPSGCLSPFSWPDDRRLTEEGRAQEAIAAVVPPEPAAATVSRPSSAAGSAETTAVTPAEDGLSRAADCLDRGDELGALPHLQTHVRAHPDAIMIRAHLAELHFRLHQLDEARVEYERFVVDAQLVSGPANQHLIHCHTRLMEIAETTDHAFDEQLHRGIGLLLLVKRWDSDPARRDGVAGEQTLAKALTALRAAKDEQPHDPRVNLYVAETLDRLGQASAARAAYRVARAGLPDPAVTPAERERIEVGAAEHLR
ncbi:hypothetical protein [Fimbriiglobus ruber]|uniref:Tetratricopeptide repeat protein n=1 Tax=Fimbriiglobus ruber TaxID=1908690 RepID=A0A225EED0_9BACT|nr:hypothetical protein [Fimbriiglobus ruber]OWK46657.1 hypothetical protein FRUB_00356 [Fimbriiglobus ruber]